MHLASSEAASLSRRTGRPFQPKHLRGRTEIGRPRMAHFRRNRIKKNPSASEEGSGSPWGPGTGVWLERGAEVADPAHYPRAGGGRGARREARLDCSPPRQDWVWGNERPRRPALRREVPSHRP